MTSPPSEVIAASEWQVVANIAMTFDESEMSRYGEFFTCHCYEKIFYSVLVLKKDI